jgi:uncharacterized protein (TIGR03086 family)
MASDWAALQRLAAREFGARIAAVTDWHAPTPDTDWDTADLVRHVVDEQRWVAPLLAGYPMERARRRLDPIGSDLAAEWERHAAEASEAWAAADPTALVELSSDTVTVHEYLREQTSDVIIHTWDLARAAGAEERLPDELVEAAWDYFSPIQETLEGTGLFASRVELPDDAPLQHRLLALTGRDPR